MIELVHASLRSRAERLAARKLNTRVDADAAAVVHGDSFLLLQAVGNLLDHAIEFSPESGAIIVAVTANVDRCAVEVRDQGPGPVTSLAQAVGEAPRLRPRTPCSTG